MVERRMATISSIDELRTLYRQPSPLVQAKVKPAIDPVSKAFIDTSSFLLVATRGTDGRVDVSPRGGPAGFVRVLDDGRMAIPDLNGNNLLDTLENIITTGEAGTIVIVPGRNDTLRVNGAALVTTDPDILDGFTLELRRPTSAIVIEPREVFIHCPKAFRRGGVWEPESWPTAGPDAVDILRCQLDITSDESEMRAAFAKGVDADLAADRPD
jgi:uncharacterized protein